MAECKDCLHFDVCGGFTPTDLDSDVFDYCREGRADEIPDIEMRCNNFKNKADVVEVRHGEWVEDGYNDSPCVCSICGNEADYVCKFIETFDYDWEENLQSTGYEEIKEYIRTPYCPNCGAKMDGKDDVK